ncbi:hypothetical protein L3X38_038194 [Prunus dulcis]|uniref:Uncharacterized protein n=1 Tax=Prunus dulcis TaxID=3755 RepID=A0AAD4YR66_PRUDU|nr:hypothetical protein L3X38_038194 [Prunus dulcis]
MQLDSSIWVRRLLLFPLELAEEIIGKGPGPKCDLLPLAHGWPLFEHFGPILGGFEVWVYLPSSRTASPENEFLRIYWRD